MPATALLPARRRSSLLPTTRWLRPFNDPVAVNGLLHLVNPTWSVDEIRARVVHTIRETDDTLTLVMQPGARWPGFRAGQHVVIEVEIDGVRQHRSYSLSSAPQEDRITLTVKGQPNGNVSAWLQQGLHPGDIVTLSAPGGDFVLPTPVPRKLLLIGAGSGVTPLMSMLRDLHARKHDGEIVFLHVCRNREDAIFGKALRELAAQWPSFRLLRHYTARKVPREKRVEHRRLDADALRRLIPDLADFHTMLCGPEGFMTMVRDLWHELGASDRLQIEHFGCAAARSTGVESTQSVQVTCTKSASSFRAAGQPLLQEAENAGLKPRHGCRIGICRSCQCRKVSGTVENLSTGEVSSAPDQLIQLCISAARSDLTLEL